MAAPAKFLFDTDFAAPDRTRERAATAAEIAQKIADAEARAYRAGYEAAQREAKVESDRRSALALEEIGIAIRASPRASPASRPGWRPRRSRSRSRWRASCAANWSSANRSARSRRWSATASPIWSRPRISSSASTTSSTRPRARRSSGRPPRSGFEGRLVILAEPGIATGDCRIEWADGGVVLERAAIEAKISELVGRYLASRDQAAT